MYLSVSKYGHDVISIQKITQPLEGPGSLAINQHTHIEQHHANPMSTPEHIIAA